MLKKIVVSVFTVALATSLISSFSYGQSTTSTTTQQTVTTPKKKAAAATVETTQTTVTTTPATVRPTYDQETLVKMNNTLCVDGFDAKVGNDNKNVCSGKATAPDLAYSCIWTKKGEGAYPPTVEGPCNLDFTEHRGEILITKADYKSSPPLAYGSKVECCFRAASGAPTTSVRSSTSTSPVKK